MELSATKKYTPMTRVRYEQPHRHGVYADPNWYKSMEYVDLKAQVFRVLAEGMCLPAFTFSLTHHQVDTKEKPI
ncbi:hypothetical protein N7449_000070 [Penicillium cf. viridicatum]|uniref:Uncharacterized protein n=1 Tax=Penicillium cf. viridicatum TaxID=2972119 RepID=A0A9W9T865_9EURO|nr:hypothetical protein N7449_000070 [Penicillium cf. viridicatum]